MSNKKNNKKFMLYNIVTKEKKFFPTFEEAFHNMNGIEDCDHRIYRQADDSENYYMVMMD